MALTEAAIGVIVGIVVSAAIIAVPTIRNAALAGVTLAIFVAYARGGIDGILANVYELKIYFLLDATEHREFTHGLITGAAITLVLSAAIRTRKV